MDAQGSEVARRFTESAGATFTTAVDRAQGLWELYGFKVVPNGFFVDELGILRYVNIGGFDVRNPEDTQAIEKLLAEPLRNASLQAGTSSRSGRLHSGTPAFSTVQEALRQAEEDWQRNPENIEKLLTLAERRVEANQYDQARRDFETALAKNPRSTRALIGLAAVYLDQGQREKAAAALKQARALDPDNWIIRKQIWAVEHPEQFYPAINSDWQAEQVKKEDAKR